MVNFGEYLRKAREAAGIPSQRVAAEEVSRLGRKVSQSLIAQYETARIGDPDPAALRLLAQVYKRDYMELVFQLMLDKYRIEEAAQQSELVRERLKLWEAGLVRFEKVGEVEGLEEAQLRAKAALARDAEVLDVAGLAEWQRRFPDLKTLWIVAPHSFDESHPRLREAAIYNLKRGVKLSYFVRKDGLEERGKLWRLRRILVGMDRKITDTTVKRQIQGIALEDDDLKWINTDVVIANPLRLEKAVGFASLRREGLSGFAIRMAQRDLEIVVSHLAGRAG